MKTRTKRMLLFTLIVACLAALVVFHSAAAYSDSPYYAQQEAAYFSNLQEYIEELPVKVVDHVVYLKANDGKSYTVISYFDTKEAMDTKRVVLQNEIDGIPVTRVQVGYDFGAWRDALEETRLTGYDEQVSQGADEDEGCEECDPQPQSERKRCAEKSYDLIHDA